ncbi:predicted protein [Naegleria gruberi]|uniref:Predicted protein n=1 Tax=Naegleria gruberi TaxID=5762 RepID=D2VMX4_NAEGR|nr:uncharacterized protein NAEGRDRAFT_70293 [Naegleria gruberi]EFC41817.1 predicted protein [Naegleria gruberi]|eukprot:XP_002674561.1 predicted protein [Naegleria gruberi strain NEG-M]
MSGNDASDWLWSKSDLVLSSLQQQMPQGQNGNKPLAFGELYRLQNFSPREYTQASIGLTIAFILGFLALGLIIMIFFSRNKYRKTMVMNQKFILMLVGLLLAIQIFSLISRIIFEAISLDIIDDISLFIQQQNGTEAMQNALATMNSTVTAAEAGVSDSPIFAMAFFGAIYIFTTSANLAVITLIVTFVSFVFFKTIKRGGTISKSHYVFLSIFGDAFGVFVFVIVLLISLTLGIVYLLVSIGLSSDFQTGLYIGVYVPYVVQILLQTILFNVSLIVHLFLLELTLNSSLL